MKLTIVTPKGIEFDGSVEYIVVNGNNGQLAILENHVPIIVPIRSGFIKSVNQEIETYYVISGGILEHHQNTINVTAQEVASGISLEFAQKELEIKRSKQRERNRERAINFTEMERELARNLKEAKASQL